MGGGSFRRAGNAFGQGDDSPTELKACSLFEAFAAGVFALPGLFAISVPSVKCDALRPMRDDTHTDDETTRLHIMRTGHREKEEDQRGVCHSVGNCFTPHAVMHAQWRQSGRTAVAGTPARASHVPVYVRREPTCHSTGAAPSNGTAGRSGVCGAAQ